MELNENPGDAISKLTLERYHCGELDDAASAALEARMTPQDREHLAELEALRGTMPGLDVAALSQRAPPAMVAEPPSFPRPANGISRLWLAPLLLLAAALLAFVLVPQSPPDHEPGDILFRGGELQMFALGPRGLEAWDGRPMGEGDVVGFRVSATDHEGVVLLSVDGEGRASVLWPEGDANEEPLRGSGMVPLPGTLTLDDAPGPEVFVAVYDTPADSAQRRALHVFEEEGVAGLERWAEGEKLVDVIVMPRVR